MPCDAAQVFTHRLVAELPIAATDEPVVAIFVHHLGVVRVGERDLTLGEVADERHASRGVVVVEGVPSDNAAAEHLARGGLSLRRPS